MGYMMFWMRVEGPQDLEWVSIENHPDFADLVATLEALTPPKIEEETRLDMNPLIDVSLVLLIFFILSTTYEELRKELPSPPVNQKDDGHQGIKPMKKEEVTKQAISVTVATEGGKSTYTVAGTPATANDLQEVLAAKMKESGLRRVAVDALPGATFAAFVTFQDAATGAGVEEILRIDRKFLK